MRRELTGPQLRFRGDRGGVRRLGLQLLGEIILLVKPLLCFLPLSASLNREGFRLCDTGGELGEQPGDASDLALLRLHVATGGENVVPAGVVDRPGCLGLAHDGTGNRDGENRNDRDENSSADAQALGYPVLMPREPRRPPAIRVLIHVPDSLITRCNDVTLVTSLTSVTVATAARCGQPRPKRVR